MAAIIRRIDELGRIAIPREIREQMGITEGTQFEIVQTGNFSISLLQVSNKNNFLHNIISLKNYLNYGDIKKEISPESIDKIDEKLDEIKNIIFIGDYINTLNEVE